MFTTKFLLLFMWIKGRVTSAESGKCKDLISKYESYDKLINQDVCQVWNTVFHTCFEILFFMSNIKFCVTIESESETCSGHVRRFIVRP